MSGGFFEYDQFRCTAMANAIESLIKECVEDARYSEETIAKFREAAQCLKRAGEMAHRIDWLVSGDDSEETFHERWKEKCS